MAKTFSNQSKLPRLPIPPLEATLTKYRKTLVPALTPEEFKRADAAIQVFMSPKGLGKELQQRLLKYDQTQPNSWLEKWWLELAYLSWRAPLMINSNWFLSMRDQHLPFVQDYLNRSTVSKGIFTSEQLQRASGFITNLLNYKELIETEQIAPDETKQGPMCMNQLRHMFGVTRIPGLGKDTLREEFPCMAKHIVVLARDQLFRVDVYDTLGNRLSLKNLERLLREVVEQVESYSRQGKLQPCIPILTAEERDTWAKARSHLWKLSKKNQTTFNIIETSIFTLSLDDFHVPGFDMDLSHKVIAHGLDGHNRWFDKALNMIVTASGRGGCNGEHSPQDALTPAVMFQYIVENEPAKDPRNCSPSTSCSLHPVIRLEWDVDATVRDFLVRAEENNLKGIANSDIGILSWHEYGSDFIKQSKCSPDAFVQMVMQLAFYKMHGFCAPTYETAATRFFKHGRTETCRTLSEDSKAWCEAMVQSSRTPQERMALFRKSVQSHIKYISEACNGMGVDRHLLGLKLMMKSNEKCELFEDPSYAKSCEWLLSTSGLSPQSYQALAGTGFGAVYPRGYGINYLIGPQLIQFGIESKRACLETSTDLFRLHLAGVLREMRELILATHAHQVSSRL
jgi:carnitine O-acetyltransferase